MQKNRHLIDALCEKVKEINRRARKLHIGVYFEEHAKDEPGMEKLNPAISEHAILQASMIDALGAIYNMFESATRASGSTTHAADPNSKMWRQAFSFGDEACNLLEKARDGLIAEATGSAPGECLGPVVTSEAIAIKLLERLSKGVYSSGSVSIVNVLEECLEQLVSDMTSRRSSRY